MWLCINSLSYDSYQKTKCNMKLRLFSCLVTMDFFLLTCNSYPRALGQNPKVVHKLLDIVHKVLFDVYVINMNESTTLGFKYFFKKFN